MATGKPKIPRGFTGGNGNARVQRTLDGHISRYNDGSGETHSYGEWEGNVHEFDYDQES